MVTVVSSVVQLIDPVGGMLTSLSSKEMLYSNPVASSNKAGIVLFSLSLFFPLAASAVATIVHLSPLWNNPA